MDNHKIVIYTRSADLPPMPHGNYFHGVGLFRIYEQTPRHKPFMVVAFSPDGGVVAHMLAVVRYRWSWLPPYLYMHCRVFGEGDYAADSAANEELFGAMLNALTRRLRRRVLYVEFSDLSKKMFGYKEFRRAGYFPVHWMSVYNSLHSRVPEERISKRMMRRVELAAKRGVTTVEVADEDDLLAFVRLVKAHNKLKPRRCIPDEKFFRCMLGDDDARLFITKCKGRTVGCCACVYSGGTAYVWHLASLRKSFVKLHRHGLGGDKARPSPRLRACMLHGCRASIPQEPIPRLHPSFRRQAREHLSVVLHYDRLGQQGAQVDLPRLTARCHRPFFGDGTQMPHGRYERHENCASQLINPKKKSYFCTLLVIMKKWAQCVPWHPCGLANSCRGHCLYMSHGGLQMRCAYTAAISLSHYIPLYI